MLTLRKRHENGTSPLSKESTKLMNNLAGCCTASAHGVSLNVVETIVLGTQAQREEDARAGPTGPPLSDGMLSAMLLLEGASEGLAAQSLLAEIGKECSLRGGIGSSAITGIVKRAVIGKVRHLDTRPWWIRERVRDGTTEKLQQTS